MRVFLAGAFQSYSVGSFFRNALEALGHEYAFIDEGKYLSVVGRSPFHKVMYRALRRRPLTFWKYNRDLVSQTWKFKPEVVLVTKGAYVSPDSLAEIKEETGALLVNYATDDPFNPASGTPNLRSAIPFYDLFACTKRAIMADVEKAGCPNARFVRFGYEPSMHHPEVSRSEEELRRFRSDVVFVGGGDRDRYPYFRSLMTRLPDLSLHLHGGRWSRDRFLKTYDRGEVFDREFRLAVGGGKIAPCLVRRANRDGHCMRTFETPACGAFMLAERTEEHLELFEEEKDAAYFDTPEEMADKVRYYLNSEAERARMAEAAYAKVTGGRHTYRDRLAEILLLAESIRHPHRGVFLPSPAAHATECAAT